MDAHTYVRIINCFGIILCLLQGFSCSNKQNPIDSDTAEISLLISRAIRNRDSLLQPKIADSLLDEALKKSIVKDNPLSTSKSYTALIRYKQSEKISDATAEEYYRQAVENANKLGSQYLKNDASFAMCEYYLQVNKPNQALNYLNLVEGDFEADKIKKLLFTSRINREQNLPFDQLRNLLDANYMAIDTENDSLKSVSFLMLSDFYFYQKKYEKALSYTERLKQTIQKHKPVDSVAWYYAEENRLAILTQKIDNKAIPDLAKKIVDFGKKKNIPKLSWNAESSLRTYFINNLQFKEIDQWYIAHPKDLLKLKETSSSLYYRVKAFIAEYHKKLDSAQIYQNKAGTEIENESPYFIYNYYLRKAEFEQRNEKPEQAENDFKKSYSYCLKTNDYYNHVTLGQTLAAYSEKRGDFTKANSFLKVVNTAKENIIKVLGDENLRDIELPNILAQKELEHQKLLENTERKHFTQYLIMSLFILLFIMSMVVISFYKIPSWWLKSMGYISFIMFFEFCILLIDTWLHTITKGNPILILLAKIGIISILFPLHHWIEKEFVNILLKGSLRSNIRNLVAKLPWKKNKNILKLDE